MIHIAWLPLLMALQDAEWRIGLDSCDRDLYEKSFAEFEKGIARKVVCAPKEGVPVPAGTEPPIAVAITTKAQWEAYWSSQLNPAREEARPAVDFTKEVLVYVRPTRHQHATGTLKEEARKDGRVELAPTVQGCPHRCKQCHYYTRLLRVERAGAKVLVVSDATYAGEIPLGK